MIDKENVKIIIDYLKENTSKMLKEPDGALIFPFVQAGAGYSNDLWDWDSYWSTFGIIELNRYVNKSEEPFMDKNKLSTHAVGNILNFLHLQHDDGFIPIVTSTTGLFSSYLSDEHTTGNKVNQHKPFLCTNTLLAASMEENIEFVRPYFNKLEKYIDYYYKNQYDIKSGLFIWINDIMIGIDNNPAVYGRLDCTTADIYLNCFMVNELKAMSQIAKKLGFANEANFYIKKANELIQSIQEECWDERDGLFYSVDISVKTNVTEVFNHGIGAFWNSVPLKIRTWASFLPMYAGFATKEQAARMVERHFLDEKFNSPYGIRTLSADEKMYNTENTSNPSNWLGAIWIVANYCMFKGLLNYGYTDLATELASKTVELLSKDIRENGHMSESYVPESGKPMMHGGFFNWNLMVLSMLLDLENN